MQCPACDHVASAEEFGADKQCPDCGAYYEKALVVRAKRNEIAHELEAKRERQQSMEQAVTKVSAVLDRLTPSARKPAPVYRPDLYCTACGTLSNGKRHTPGHFLVEVVLWLCLFVPGIIYSIWRLSASKPCCTACGSTAVVPSNSPRAYRDYRG